MEGEQRKPSEGVAAHVDRRAPYSMESGAYEAPVRWKGSDTVCLATDSRKDLSDLRDPDNANLLETMQNGVSPWPITSPISRSSQVTWSVRASSMSACSRGVSRLAAPPTST